MCKWYRYLVALATLTTVVFVACNGGKRSNEPVKFDSADTVQVYSYMLGRDIGKTVNSMDADIDMDILLAAVHEAVKDSLPSQLNDSATSAVDRMFRQILQARREQKSPEQMAANKTVGGNVGNKGKKVNVGSLGNKGKNVNSLEMVKVNGGKIGNATVGDFSIGKYEVTQKLWGEIMDIDFPNEEKNLPIANVSYNEVKTFLQMLNKKTGKNYRLPTEEEWKYAARGGNKSKGYKYFGGNEIIHVAWFRDNSGGRVHNVGTREPNELGIYDMNGNVWEWTGSLGSMRRYIFRGCGWDDDAESCRTSDYGERFLDGDRHYDLGFRLALDP